MVKVGFVSSIYGCFCWLNKVNFVQVLAYAWFYKLSEIFCEHAHLQH